jgi:hypothetical protein
LFFLSITSWISMIKSRYLHSRKYGGWSCELEFRAKLEICKLQIWSSPFLTRFLRKSVEPLSNVKSSL